MGSCSRCGESASPGSNYCSKCSPTPSDIPMLHQELEGQKAYQAMHERKSQKLERCEYKGCFPYAVPVLTPTGWKKIGGINIGNSILSCDLDLGKLHIREVTKKLEHPPTTIWMVSSLKSQSVLTTSHHPFLTEKGWVLTKNLKIGDKLLKFGEDSKNDYDPITLVEATDHVEPVYNLHTAGEHTFIVQGGYVAHNFAYFRALRTIWHQIFIDPRVPAKKPLAQPISTFQNWNPDSLSLLKKLKGA